MNAFRFQSLRIRELTNGFLMRNSLNYRSHSIYMCTHAGFQQSPASSLLPISHRIFIRKITSNGRTNRFSIEASCGQFYYTRETGATEFFVRHKVLGDGRCLFRSLAQAIHLENQRNAHGVNSRPRLLSQTQETRAADALRAMVCEEMCQQRPILEHFIEMNFDDYIQRMAHASVWGGEPELFAAACVLDRCVEVFSPSESWKLQQISEYGREKRKDKRSVALLYADYMHYDLLERIQQSNEMR